jgi:hypothetical protein
MNMITIATAASTLAVTATSLLELRNPGNIGDDLTIGLMVYSALFTRYCFKIKPINRTLALANGFNFIAQAFLLREKLKWEKNEKGKLLRRF